MRMLTTSFTNCSGWPEPRVYLEGQQWFTDIGRDINTESKHVHVGACVPVGQVLRGKVTLDVLVQMHLMDDRVLHRLLAGVDLDESDPPGRNITRVGELLNLNMDCKLEINCKRVYRMVMDTTLLPDGWNNLRLWGAPEERDPNMTDLTKGQGFTLHAMVRYDVYINNGQPAVTVPPSAIPSLSTGRGFMSFPWKYTNAQASVPMAPVSGIWRVDVRSMQFSAVANITRTVAALNPAFHAIPVVLGVPLLDTPGQFSGSLSINTTALPNGYHKLFIRTDVFVPPTVFPGTEFNASRPFPGSTNSGVLLVAFRVAN